MTKACMSIPEFLHWGNLSRTKFYSEVKEGRIKMRKVGRKSVVTIRDAEEWLANLPEANRAE